MRQKWERLQMWGRPIGSRFILQQDDGAQTYSRPVTNRTGEEDEEEDGDEEGDVEVMAVMARPPESPDLSVCLESQREMGGGESERSAKL